MKKLKTFTLNTGIILILFASLNIQEVFSQEKIALPPLSPVFRVPVIESRVEIDGETDPLQSLEWTPVSRINWENGAVESPMYFSLGWNRNGLFVTTRIPGANPGKLMRTGRTPEAPFLIDINLDAQLQPDPVGTGKYTLRFIPLVEDVSRMIYRTQPFLMNHRLGSNSNWNDQGIVIWTETTITGIETDNILARWNYKDEYTMEIFIPWENLRVPGLSDSQPVYFNISVSLPGDQPLTWIDEMNLKRETGAELILIDQSAENRQSGSGNTDPSILLPSNLHRQSEKLKTALIIPENSAISGSEMKYSLRNESGKLVNEKITDYAGKNDYIFQNINTAGLDDGIYTLKISSAENEQTIASRVLVLAENRINGKNNAHHSWLKSRLRTLKKEETEPWVEGHISRIELLLKLSDPGKIEKLEDLNQSNSMLKEAELALDQLEKGIRPFSGRENHRDIAGFTAEGQRGNIDFIPVRGNNAYLKIKTQKEYEWKVNPLIYGTFSEPVVYDRPIYGWLYAQLLRNPGFEWGFPRFETTIRSFSERYQELEKEGVKQILEGKWVKIINTNEEEVAAPWAGTGNGEVSFSLDSSALNTYTCQKVAIATGNSSAGVCQVLSLPVWRCASYDFITHLRSDSEVHEIKVRLYYEGKVIDEASFDKVNDTWKKYHAILKTPSVNSEQNTFLLSITTEEEGSFYIDQVSLFPSDNIKGFDPQVLEQFNMMKTGWTRWPGGNYASAYNWRNGIGPESERPALPNPAWPGLNSRAMGTDEYIEFTRLTDQEPLICVNAGTGSPEEAADWVEYCNGSPETEMGKLRSDYGSTEPFNVRYWNIGNEFWGSWQWGHCEAGEYADRYLQFKKAMEAVDPGLRFITCATGAHTAGRPDWTLTLLDRVGKELDIMDFHTYVGVPAVDHNVSEPEAIQMMISIPVAYEQALMEFRRECIIRGLDHVKVDVGEYNNNNIRGILEEKQILTDLLTYAGWLHGFIRQGEYVMGGNATDYSPFQTRGKQFGNLHPRFDLFRIYREEIGNLPVYAEIQTPVWQSPNNYGKDVNPIFNIPLVDVVVLKNDSDGSLGIGIINRDLNNEILLHLDLGDFNPRKKGKQFIFGVGLDQDESPATLSDLQIMQVDVARQFEIKLAPLTVNLIKVYEESPVGIKN